MVKVFLSYQSEIVQLPVPPPEYGVDSPWKNQQTGSQLPDALQQPLNLIGIRDLRKVVIASFFPILGHDYPFNQNKSMWGRQYVNKIEAWRAKRYPLRLVIVDDAYHDVNMLVTIDDFQHKVAQDGDIAYTLTMTEFVKPKVS